MIKVNGGCKQRIASGIAERNYLWKAALAFGVTKAYCSSWAYLWTVR